MQIAATTPSDRGLGIQGFLTDQFATTLHASVIPSAGEHIGRRIQGDVTGVTVLFGVGIAADAGGTVTSRIRRSVHGSRFGRAEQIGKLGGHLIDGHFVKIFVPGLVIVVIDVFHHHERQTIVGSLRVVADGLGVLGLPIQITLKQFNHLAGSGHLDRFGREGAFPIGTGQIGDGTILPMVRVGILEPVGDPFARIGFGIGLGVDVVI